MVLGKLQFENARASSREQSHILFDECEDMHVEFVSIKSPADGPNTDGIHVKNRKNVEIFHSLISSGVFS